MIPYLQVERITAGQIGANAALVFDNVLLNNGTDISYNDTTGVITFNTVGVYFINWFVGQQTGLSSDGSNFAIVTSDSDPDFGASSHVKISPASGFAIIDVETVGKAITLTNKSSYGATLSQTTQVKAGLAVFALADTSVPPPTIKLGYSQAQVSVGGAQLAQADQIIFDEVIKLDTHGIVTYDDVTGIFTIGEKGTYLVTWEIPVSATDTNDFVVIDLELNGATYTSSHMPLPIGVLSGSAIVVIDTVDSTLQLVNPSADTVEITDLCNIVITQITSA